MSSVLKISEAAVLALHGMAFLASNSDKLSSTREIATKLRVSEAHLSKVLQRLSKVGLVKSIRGPKGGFALGKASNEISLLDVYESIDGEFMSSDCLLGDPVYNTDECILGGLVKSIDEQVKGYLEGTKLNQLSCWGRCHEDKCKQNDKDQQEC